MKRTPDNTQPPQASASTNSAIRAGYQIPDEECPETDLMSSTSAHVEKFQDEDVGAQIREVRHGNKFRRMPPSPSKPTRCQPNWAVPSTEAIAELRKLAQP